VKIPDLPGVYKWTNKINGKIYIGKAVNLRLRKNGHAPLKKGTGAFANAKRKYGIENFEFSIIEIFPNRTSFIEDYIVERETFWIGFYDATNKSKGYNICPSGSSTVGIPMPAHVKEAIRKANASRKISAETSRKMSEARTKDKLSEEARWKMGSSTRGKKISPDTIAKRVAKTKGQKRPTICIPILQICPRTQAIIRRWESSTQAAIELYGDAKKRPHIGLCLRGLAKTALGFIWKREKDYV